MNDTTKAAASAVAGAHKTPSRSTIDTAQDELATLNYKLGRAQVAAMLSAGQAKADKAVLEDLTAQVEAKRASLEAMVETFTNPPRPDQAAALEAIREKLRDRSITANKVPTAQIDQQKAVDAVIEQPKIRAGSIDGALIPGASIEPAAIKNLTVDEVDALEGRGKAAGAVIEAIFNARPGDVEIPDTGEPEPIKPAPTVYYGKRPPAAPLQGNRWRYGSVDMTFDPQEGWMIVADAGTPQAHARRAVPEDLTSDYWERGELAQIFADARPRRPLFSGRG